MPLDRLIAARHGRSLPRPPDSEPELADVGTRWEPLPDRFELLRVFRFRRDGGGSRLGSVSPVISTAVPRSAHRHHGIGWGPDWRTLTSAPGDRARSGTRTSAAATADDGPEASTVTDTMTDAADQAPITPSGSTAGVNGAPSSSRGTVSTTS